MRRDVIATADQVRGAVDEQKNQTVVSNISLKLKSLGQMLQILGIDLLIYMGSPYGNRFQEIWQLGFI